MRAVTLLGHDRPPQLRNVALPEPGPDEVRVAMRACGICGSDVHIVDGLTVPAMLPIVLGHEASGVVDRLGPGVSGLAVGDRVTTNPMITCGRCSMCLAGRGNLCRNISILGLHADGAHAEFFVVPAHNLIALPDSVSFELGAIVADAIGTPMRAITAAGIRAGSVVAVFGLGGLGLHAAMILSQIHGCDVIGVDASDAALDRAARFGIDTVFDARSGRVADRIRAATGGGVAAAFEFVGSLGVVEQALRSLDHGGVCTVVGVGPDRLALTVRQETLVARGLTLAGSHGYVDDDIRQLLAWLDSGRLVVEGTVTHRFDLAEYGQGLAALRDPDAGAIRVVITNQ